MLCFLKLCRHVKQYHFRFCLSYQYIAAPHNLSFSFFRSPVSSMHKNKFLVFQGRCCRTSLTSTFQGGWARKWCGCGLDKPTTLAIAGNFSWVQKSFHEDIWSLQNFWLLGIIFDRLNNIGRQEIVVIAALASCIDKTFGGKGLKHLLLFYSIKWHKRVSPTKMVHKPIRPTTNPLEPVSSQQNQIQQSESLFPFADLNGFHRISHKLIKITCLGLSQKFSAPWKLRFQGKVARTT